MCLSEQQFYDLNFVYRFIFLNLFTHLNYFELKFYEMTKIFWYIKWKILFKTQTDIIWKLDV